MGTKLIATVAAAVAILATAAAPTAAADPEPQPEGFTLLGWYNDNGRWGYLLSPRADSCRPLTPDIDPGALVVNYTGHQAVFYTAEDCKGDTAFTAEPGSTFNGAEKGAKSVKLTTAHDNPEPQPQPKK